MFKNSTPNFHPQIPSTVSDVELVMLSEMPTILIYLSIHRALLQSVVRISAHLCSESCWNWLINSNALTVVHYNTINI
jgi:hypothetical protein